MSPFAKLLSRLDVKPDSTGEHGWLFLMLSALADLDTDPPVATFPDNPAAECVVRLSAYEGVAFKRVRVLLNDVSDKFARGR